MKIIKKLLLITVIAALAVSAAACSKTPKDAGEDTDSAAKVEKIDDLPGKKIGVQLGTVGDTYASDYEKEGSTVERYNKGADAVFALKQGKIDCVIIDNEPAKVFVSENTDLKILEEPFAVEDYAMCIAKENAELKTKIDEALTALKADGTIDKILANYIGDGAGKTPYKKDESISRSGTLIMATNAAFPPYEYIDTATEAVVGIDADIAQAVADKLGMELKIEDMDFDAIIPAVQSGKVNIGVAGMTVTEERLQSIDFTQPYATGTQVIIVKK